MVLNKAIIADELEIQNSCSLKLNGKMFYLGGGTDKNQGTESIQILNFIYYDFEKRSQKIPNKVLMMNPDENNFQDDPFIRLNATLPFNFKEGACGTFIDQYGNEFALLCFDREDPTTCYKCSDLENGICKLDDKLKSVPTRKSRRNAIRIGKYQGRIQMPIQTVFRL